MSEFTENEYDLIYEWAWDFLGSAHIGAHKDFNLDKCPVEHFEGLTTVEIETAQAIMKKVKRLMYGR